MFDYPKVEEKKSDEKKHVATAVLSTTAKAKAREARKEAKKLGRAPSQDAASSAGPIPDAIPLERVHSHLSTISYLSIEEKGPVEEVKPAAKKEREPTSFVLNNPARLVPAQSRFVSLIANQRYEPVFRRSVPTGIVVLLDTDPTAPEDVVRGSSRFNPKYLRHILILSFPS